MPPALLLPVAYSAYGGGLVIGLSAAVLHVLYTAIFFSLPGHPFQYDAQNLERVLVIMAVAPAMAAMLGNLRHKTELSLRQLRAAKQDLLRLNSELEMRVEERTAEIVRMIAKTNSEKQAAKTELARTFDAKIGNLVRELKARAREMEETAHSMSDTAEEAGRVSTLATTFAEQTSKNVRQMAAATDQLAKSAREIGSRALSSADLVTKAVEYARRTDDTVQVMSDRSKTDRASRKADLGCRGTNQPVGIECHHRGGARRSGRKGLRRRGSGGQEVSPLRPPGRQRRYRLTWRSRRRRRPPLSGRLEASGA